MAQQAMTRRQARPTTPADLWRLAEQGERNGVRLLTECLSGERFATSASEPGVIYRLTAYSCACKGFAYWGRCQHHSLLLKELGWLPDLDDEPEPPDSPAAPAAKIVPFPAARTDAATAAKAVAWVEHMADLAGDEPADLFPAA